MQQQRDFDSMFKGQTYGYRGDTPVRDWHVACVTDYSDSVDAWDEADDAPKQHCYTVYAGTGSGKTQCAGHLAAYMRNSGKVDQVVLVCPNRSIRRRAKQVFFDVFNIDLVVFNARKHADGIGRAKEGYILTYAHLIQNPQLHRRICSANTIVIFDEIHHLGDKNGWGEAAVEAFGRVRHVVALTGTPYRSDNTRIPFVTYEEVGTDGLARFRPDFAYTLGQAVADGVCRKPLFRFHKATVRIRPQADAGELEVTFDDTNVTDQIASLRLRGAVQYGSPARLEMLRSALDECRAENRKVVIFLGGDSDSEHTATTDATQLLPTELHELGIGEHEYEVVVGVDKEAQDKIAKFGASPKWILVSVNMVSEGTDIPELSAAIFLTSVTAKQTTVQRIGRALRFMGPTDTNPEAVVFMFGDANLLALADEIEKEIEVEVNLRRKQATETKDGTADGARRRAETVCISGGQATIVKFGGHTFPADMVQTARARLRESRLPNNMLHAVLLLMMEQGDLNVAG